MPEKGICGCRKAVVSVGVERYLPRLIDDHLTGLLAEHPAVMLLGPRGSGKTTTAIRRSEAVVRLDRPAEAAAFRADPDAALAAIGRNARPLVLDEWQEVPEVFGAVKRAVDGDPAPGRFLLTGSVSAELEGRTWPGTGRVLRVPMTILAVREQLRRPARPPFLALLERGDEVLLPPEPPDLAGYVDLALAGGFPEPALRLSPEGRRRWYASYLDDLLSRDVGRLVQGLDVGRLRRYFEAYALNTAGLADHKTIYDAAGVTRKTAVAYDRLLQALMVVENLPAWTSNRLKRLIAAEKRYLVDPALLLGVTRLGPVGVLRDGDLLGRVLDTFVLAQLRAELALVPHARLHHLRTEHGRQEVDLVAELDGERVIGIEVKATSAPSADDARHLIWLRERLGARFVRGVVLHTGRFAFELGERVLAVPICALWG